MKAQYLINGDSIKIAYHYNADKDLMIEIRKKGGNMLMDFYRFSLFERGKKIWELIEDEIEILQTTPTDWHGPFIVEAVDNIDGDDVGSYKFTGGNHEYSNTGVGGAPNARTTILKFYVDKNEVTQGYGYSNDIEIHWKNRLQANNTQKVDGSGREVLVENHIMKFDGKEFTTYFEICPIEDVYVRTWYGLQGVAPNTIYDTVRYVGGVDDSEHHIDDLIPCGNNSATKVIVTGKGHRFEMEIDTNVDLGDRRMYNETSGIFHTNWNKFYFYVIRNQHLRANNTYKLKGTYRFLSN